MKKVLSSILAFGLLSGNAMAMKSHHKGAASDPVVAGAVEVLKDMPINSYEYLDGDKIIEINYSKNEGVLEVEITHDGAAYNKVIEIRDIGLDGLDDNDTVRYDRAGYTFVRTNIPYIKFKELSEKNKVRIETEYSYILNTLPARIEKHKGEELKNLEENIKDVLYD